MTDLDRIKSAVNIADLVSQLFELAGQGRYLKAKQHDSLVVDTQQQTYYWNSRGENGDAIDWVGRYCLDYDGQWNSSDSMLFKEAVTWLAKYTGQPEPQFRPEDADQRRERLTKEYLMSLATDYYLNKLQYEEIQGYQYAVSRGFSELTINGNNMLGYADGHLWQVIPDQDRPAAADLGLIYRPGRQWKDAIPAGYLVYIHRHRGKIEYLAGRSITEKRHCNIRAEKRMFWAILKYDGPLVIGEGQADALSIAQLGVNALGLCGVNLSDFDPDMVRLFNPVYIWQDADDPDSEAGKAWARRLNDLAGKLGPLIRVIQVDEVKDANDYLQAGATPDDLQNLLKESGTFLDQEIERLAGGLQGADLYDELEPLFCRLTDLDVFQLNLYRSKVCRRLNVSQADFGRYMKAAKGTLSDDEEGEFAKGGQYTVIDGWTVHKSFTEDGKPKITPLANGTAKIIEEIVQDDGTNDPQLDFLLVGELENGQKLPKVQIPAAEYDNMKWVRKWGSRFILSAGRTTQDHFRAAVQHLSGTPYRRTIYTHTGWRKINDKWLYLTSSGALGAQDESIQVDLKLGRPDTNMTRYFLPMAPENIAEAMQASLKFWHIADAITVPIWAAMYLAPLFPFLTPDFGLWIYGQTGSMKSSMVATALAHFGRWQGKDAKILLPSNFQSTANNILMNAFQAKDIPLIIDDFAPGATQKEVRERDNTASNLLRSIGNKAARGRMRDGRHFQADFPPRCLAIITAEDLPKTASIMARGIGIGVTIPPKGDPARRPIEERLGQAQVTDSYFYSHAMAGFILWIQRHWDELKHDLPTIAANYRDQMQQAGHARLPDAFGKLMAAADTALYFAMDCGALTESQAKEHKDQAFKALGFMMIEHGEAVDQADACRIVQEILIEQLDARDWYLCPTDADTTSPPTNYPVGTQTVGYIDDYYIYLLTKTISEIVTNYQKLGTPFPVGRNTLYKRLIERGWLIPGQKATSTIYIAALGTSPRVLKLVKSEVLPE